MGSADYQTESIPIGGGGGGGGGGGYRNSGGGRSGVSSGHASPSLSSQNPHVVGSGYHGGGGSGGSAPSSYQRESFAAMGGDLASSLNEAGSGIGLLSEVGFAGGHDASASASGRGTSSPLHGSMGANTASDGRASPGNSNSPLMAGLTFSLDLAGYTGSSLSGGAGCRGGGGGGYRAVAGSEGALSAHGSAINSPTLFGFEMDAAGKTRKAIHGGGSNSGTGGGASGGGGGLHRSGSGRLAGLSSGGGLGGGGGSVGAMSASSPSSPLSVNGFGTESTMSLPRQLDIGPSLVGSMGPPPPRVDTSIFAFGRSGGGAASVDEVRRSCERIRWVGRGGVV